MCEEDLETTEGEGVDFLTELLDLVGCPQVDDETDCKSSIYTSFYHLMIINR